MNESDRALGFLIFGGFIFALLGYYLNTKYPIVNWDCLYLLSGMGLLLGCGVRFGFFDKILEVWK